MMWMKRLDFVRAFGASEEGVPDDLVHGVEDQRIAPHGDCNGVVAERKAKGANQ
jgi:hypothetical protein